MNKPNDPQDLRRLWKDEGPSEEDIERSWSESGDGKSGSWTERWWQILITVVGIVIVGSLVITVLPLPNEERQRPTTAATIGNRGP